VHVETAAFPDVPLPKRQAQKPIATPARIELVALRQQFLASHVRIILLIANSHRDSLQDKADTRVFEYSCVFCRRQNALQIMRNQPAATVQMSVKIATKKPTSATPTLPPGPAKTSPPNQV
jgi:hypothetical protein